jgi:hypothetical protein
MTELRVFSKGLVLMISCLLMVAFAKAGDLDKAFKYLNTGDYLNANKFLREALSDEPDNAAANWGMAKYFSSKDNKAYQLDSAIYYVKKAASKIPLNPDDKETKKFLSLGVRDYTIQALQKSINFDAYAFAEQQNTLESYQHFVDLYTDPSFLEQAVNFRNQKAYMRAMSLKSADALAEFIKKYPQSAELKEAKERYEKMLYEQTTGDQTFQSYKKYIESYPSGAYIVEARKIYNEKVLEYYVNKKSLAAYIDFEKNYKDHPAYNAIQDTIYSLATQAGTVDAFKNFVRNYKHNRNINVAWEQLYILYTAEATDEVYRKFADEFSDFPNKDKLHTDLELAKKELHPIQQADKWGYAEQPTKDSINVVIPFEYAEAYEFRNGYAAVRLKPCSDKCTYFYIDKGNHRAFEIEFNYAGDFNNGLAVVGVGNCETSDCKYGMIDKRGVLVVPAEYDEIDEPAEGLYLAMKDGKYGFIDRNGQTAISHKYTDALPFKMGLAAVAIDGNWFFIDKTGAQKFINRFLDVSSFSDSLCAVTQDKETWGFVDVYGNFVIQPQFETAEDFENGFAIVSRKEKDPKNKSLTISQRYKIDKTGKVIEKLMAPKETVIKSGKKKSRR